MRHIPDTLALFEFGGSNLSIRAAQLKNEESTRFRQRFQISSNPAVAIMARLLRTTEKLVTGCYAHAPVEYDYALDATPTYRHVAWPKASSRFRLTAREYGSRSDA